MGLSTEQRKSINSTLKKVLRNKFEKYNPEPAFMPFHIRLLGKDRLALYKFIHSLNTNFGTTIFEPVAVKLAEPRFKRAERQYIVGDQISELAQHEIQRIIDQLTTAEVLPNKVHELERIHKSAYFGKKIKIKPTKIDLYLESYSGEKFFIDLKTVKPNMGEFKGFKRTLLEWVAVEMLHNPKAKVNSLLAIPYNPYEPEPYNRWTMRGMIDLDQELKVAKEFWDFIGGDGAYEDLLDCFENVGIEMRDEIDEYFKKFRA